VIDTRTVAALAADVPLGHGLGLDVVVDRMAAVAQRAGRPLHVVWRIKLSPPVGIVFDEVAAKNLVRDIPRDRLRIVVVSDLRKIALLPDAAVHHARWQKTPMANIVRDPKEHPEAILPDVQIDSIACEQATPAKLTRLKIITYGNGA
jgi:hypothetical protein